MSPPKREFIPEPPYPWSFDYVAWRLHMKPRTLRDKIKAVQKANPGVRFYTCYLKRRKVFYREEYDRLKEAIECLSNSGKGAGLGTSVAPSEASLFTRAQKLIAESMPSRSGSSARRNCSNVVALEPARQQHS